MAKKSRLKGDVFDWVDRTTQQAEDSSVERERPIPASPKRNSKTASNRDKTALPAAAQKVRRTILVKHKDNGEIVAIQEIPDPSVRDSVLPWLEQGLDAQMFELVGDLADRPIIDIHKNYLVLSVAGTMKLMAKG